MPSTARLLLVAASFAASIACSAGAAAQAMPAMKGADGTLTNAAGMTLYVFVREDGAKQWAYKGKPLYTWAKDAKAGDKTGDGFNNVWHVAKE